MNTHPIFTEQADDENWIDWYQRQLDTVTDNPPAAPAGFYLIPCAATPRHWPKYTLYSDEVDAQYATCPDCAYADLAGQHRTCDHDINHRAWRRWKITSKVLAKLYSFGLIRGYGHRWGGGCNGCISGSINWTPFRGTYVLFVKRETWRCWRSWHRRGDEVGLGYCSKCIPWSCCGSTRRDHTKDCPERDA